MFDAKFRDLLTEAEGNRLGMARRWLSHGELDAYIRIGPKLVGDDYVSCVQIASVSISNEHAQRKGMFTDMLKRIRAATNRPIYMESVQNREFGDALLRRGFEVVRDEVVTRDLLLR